MTGEDFKGKAIPFGAKVYFKTTDTREKTYAGKFDPKGIPGVFAGYVITTGQQWSRKYKVWDMAEFAGVNLSMDAAVPRRLAQPYVTEVVVLPDDLVFPLKDEYERMNSTLEGLNDNRRLQGKEIKDADDVGRPPSGGDDDEDDDDGDESKKKPPPDPGEVDDGAGTGEISLDDYYTSVDKLGHKILERAELDAREHGAPPSSSTTRKPDLLDGIDEVGPSGRLIPKGGEEDPGEILRYLKDSMLASDDVVHWRAGTEGDGKIYLNDDGEACKIDKRGVPYKICSDGRRIVPSRRPKHQYSPEEWDKLDAKSKKKAYKKAKREKAKDARLSRKRAAVGKRIVEKVLDHVIFPKIVQCDKIDLELGSSCTEGWEWAQESVHQQLQQEFLDGVIPAVPASAVFDDNWIPAMPCTTSVQPTHRMKNGAHGQCVNAMVTRPVTRKEMLNNPKAMEAFMKEWTGLWEQEVFDFSQTREYDDVVNEAKKKGEKVHMARVHGLIYEKNYQLKEDDPARKFKGRGVLLGDQVKDQNMEAALFQDLGNSPATFDASRWADYYGCLAGNDVQMADAIQAYIQAKLSGTPCWVELPDEAWHPSANRQRYRRPVCRLVKALYGHPDAGTMWEQHCHTAVQKFGFKPLGDEWPSLYFHPDMKLLLVIYVDDLKLAGPKAQLSKGWDMLRRELRLEEETPLGLYLGCRISKGEAVLHDKTSVRTVTYDMETYLDMTVKKYSDVTGYDPSKFKTVPIAESRGRNQTSSSTGSDVQWKKSSMHVVWTHHAVDTDGRLIPPPPIPKGPVEEDVTDENRGALAPQAASILMKLLYAARICRFDLLRSINNLARKITKWTKKEDALLHHLMAYVHQSKHHLMIGWVGDTLEDSSIGLFADADYAGCGESLKSTSGAHLHIQGPHTRFPLAGLSKRQGCLSHSTPEAEIVAADFAMSRLGLPAITLWQQLGGKDPNFVFYDDNQTMIGVVRTGKHPTMRHLERTHGISIGWMHSIFQEGYVSLAYEVTAKMAADIHTKSFKDSVSWTHACQLINIFPPEQLGSFKSEVPCFPYTQTPILPQVLYRAGLSSKEGLQEHDSVDPILVVKFPRMLREPPSALPPGRYLRSTWILREGVWHQVEDRAVIPSAPAKFDRYVERAVFQFHPVRASLVAAPVVEDTVQTTLPPPYGRQYVRTLPPDWRSVVAALARAIHGPMGGTRVSHCLFVSTVVRIETGYGQAIVPHVTEFQDCKDGLIIEFYNDTKELVHAYKDEGNKLRIRIKIFDTPKEVAIWTLAGVSEDNWWQQYAPGLGDAVARDPDQHYVPQTRMNILCTGRRADDAMCEYLADVYHNKQKKNPNSAVFVGAGVLGGTSWIDKHIQKSSHKIQFRTEYCWGEVVQRIALAAAKSGTQVIVEIPPETQAAGTKQYSVLLNKELWKHNVIDGCSHGQRLLACDTENKSHIKYCDRKWEFFSANTAMDYSDLRSKEVRTSQISRRPVLSGLHLIATKDVFPTCGFMTVMTHFEKFLEIFVANQTPRQELPKKLVLDHVISNNNIHDWIKYSDPPLLMAATQEVQQKPYGDVVKYIVRAASIINQAVNDKAQRFPHFNEVFVDARVIKEGTSAASEFIEADKMGTRFDLNENYRLRENNWFVFFQDYSGRIPGSTGVRDLDEGGLVMLAKMALEFAKCVGYGLRTHNSDLEIIYQRAGSQGERPQFLDMFDVVSRACIPPSSDLEEPLAFAIHYFQAYAGAIDLMRRYLIYSEDNLVRNNFHWSSVLRPDLGMTAKEFIKNVVAKFYVEWWWNRNRKVQHNLYIALQCIQVSIPEGAVEYAFEFFKEDLQMCRGRLVHALDDPDNYLFAMYHACGIGTCEYLPTPAMLTTAALVKNEDDLMIDGNDSFANASDDDKSERTNVLLAAKELNSCLAIGGRPDASTVRTQHTFLAMDFEIYANNKKATFSLSEAFHLKGWRHLTILSPEAHHEVKFDNTIRVLNLLKQKVTALNEDQRSTTTIHIHLCLQAVVYENLNIPASTDSVAALGNMEQTLKRVYIDNIKEVIALVSRPPIVMINHDPRMWQDFQVILQFPVVSSYGGIRYPPGLALSFPVWNKAKQLTWDRAYDEEGNLCFIAYHDAGNAAYAGFLKTLLTPQERVQLFRGSANPLEELLGDVFEITLGMLTFALRFPELFPTWGDVDVINACINGLESCYSRYAAKADPHIENQVQEIIKAKMWDSLKQLFNGEIGDVFIVSYGYAKELNKEVGRRRGDYNNVCGEDIATMGPASHSELLRCIQRSSCPRDHKFPQRGDRPLYRQNEHGEFENPAYVNIGEGVYGGILEKLPPEGAQFCHPDWDKILRATHPREYGGKECGDAKNALYFLQKDLRHHLGRSDKSISLDKRGRDQIQTIKCDEGGWVSIEWLLSYDLLWCHFSRQMAYSLPSSYQNRREEMQRRLQLLINGNYFNFCGGDGKLRLQFLGVRLIPPESVPDDFNAMAPAFSNSLVHVETMRTEIRRDQRTRHLTNEHLEQTGFWIRPWAVRATTGHSRSTNTVMTLDPSRFALSASRSLMEQIGGAYHATEIYNLNAIVTEGLKTGSDMMELGRSSGRLHIYFGIFPPWDPRNKLTRSRSRHDQRTPLVTLYIPIQDLAREGGRVTDNGAVICDRTIPFHLDMRGHRSLTRILELLCDLPGSQLDGTKAVIVNNLSEYFGVNWEQTNMDQYYETYDDAVEFVILH
ncbi:unnamed protein product [Symbiodinium sp. KB8]|nr:unnamed protein product [Symbiodinium sp. KB8]